MEIFETELFLEKRQYCNIGHFRGVMVYKPFFKSFTHRNGRNIEYGTMVLFETKKYRETKIYKRTTFVGEVFTPNALKELKEIENQCIIKVEYTLCNKMVGKNNLLVLNVLKLEKEYEFGDRLVENEKTY